MTTEETPGAGSAQSLSGTETTARLASELAALNARIGALEQQVAELRGLPQTTAAPAASLALAYEARAVPSAPESPRTAPPPPPSVVPNVIIKSFDQASAVPPSNISLEKKLGGQVLNRIGILAAILGAAWGLKLAIDNDWIGPVAIILIGLAAGVGIIVWSERFRRKNFAGFSYSLKAIGSGVLYLALWAAFQIYHLLPAEAALIGMILVTAWNAYMAWVQDSQLLAAYAVAGGVVSPLLLSTGGNHEIFLFTYLLAINVATVLLVRLKGWYRLLLGTFPVTVAYFIGWYVEYFDADALIVTALFIVLFGLVFASVPILYPASAAVEETGPQKKTGGSTIIHILLPFFNAAFVALALYATLDQSGHHAALPWLALALGAAYLGLMHLPQRVVASAMHLSIAVVFLTIAIPLKLSGRWITVGWLVEGLALAWVATRVTVADASSSRILRWLSVGAFALGLVNLIATDFWFGNLWHFYRDVVARPLFNSDLTAALIAIVMLSGAVWLALSVRKSASTAWAHWTRYAIGCFLAIETLAVLISLREILTTRGGDFPHAAFRSPDFFMALISLAVLGGAAWTAFHLSQSESSEDYRDTWRQIAGGTIIGINLIAILTGEREVVALWPYTSAAPDAHLRQALAVSVFLMLYGAALLAIGFWKRTAFIRWQALALIAFTIVKIFAYDMSELSHGYRAVSFLVLAALLMAVSFAYQKDWLALRESGKHNPADTQSSNPSGSGGE
ncbi:MAG: DUF2339 domain-containing protein [Acidobacteriaceae bacterium]|nr:DUF2339 domain-containing protein [Acidobacteriaceae bacterium]